MPEIATSKARPGPAVLAATIALISLATLATVWTLQSRGYVPCELCLKERIPYEAGFVPAAALALVGRRVPVIAVRVVFVLLALLFAGGAVLGVYHTGVEWKLWAGPSECSGAVNAAADVNDFLKQLNTVAVVRCDEAALQVLGLSLAAWNAVLSAALAAVALLGWRRA